VLVTHQVDDIIPEIKRVVGLKEGAVCLDGMSADILTADCLSRLFDTPLRVVEAGGYRQVLPG
jgi:iron complex transport system ATP-binding protein